MKKTIFLLIAVLVLIFTIPNFCLATTIYHTPFAQMCREADAVIEGTVSSVSSRSIDDPGVQFPEIVTDVALTNVVAIKGSRPVTLTLTYPGGTVGDITMTVPGMPSFQVGERKIVFLERDNALFGVWEGVFTVTEPEPGLTIVQRADGPLVTGGFDASTGELTLYTPQESLSKPVLFMGKNSFVGLIREIIRLNVGGKQQVSE